MEFPAILEKDQILKSCSCGTNSYSEWSPTFSERPFLEGILSNKTATHNKMHARFSD